MRERKVEGGQWERRGGEGEEREGRKAGGGRNEIQLQELSIAQI